VTELATAVVAPLDRAIAELVGDGDSIALEGFSHLIPVAAGQEIIRQGRRDLTLVRLTPDIVYDQMIGAGCASKLIFSWGGNPGIGSLHRFRDAIENGWPRGLEIEEHSHAGLTNRYVAAASGLPFAILRAYQGTSLPAHTPTIKTISCPFTGEQLTAVPALDLDVAVVHAQRADPQGNVQMWGLLGVQKEAVLGARRSLVTVEELVDELRPHPGATILPAWAVDRVAVVAGGALPSYAEGYYERSEVGYREWDEIARDRDGFESWLGEIVAGGGAR
jgi:glutaconate CoA-transferase subunit A